MVEGVPVFTRFLAWSGLVATLWLGAVQANPVYADTLLVMGDSLSAAYGIDRERGWVHQLQERLGDEHEVINASISGETTSGGMARLPELLQRHDPDIVLLELGGNDGLRGLSPHQMKLNLANMIENSQAAGARVLLLGIEMPPNYGSTYVDAFRGVFRQLVDEYDVHLVPFILEGVALTEDMMQEDGIHPNGKAQATILNNVWEKLAPMLDEPQD
ncbi:arylesterase [Halomonas shantousis]